MEVVVARKNSMIVSERNVKIVEMYSNGEPTKNIAKKYKVTPRAIEGVVARLKTEFKCKSLTHLIATFLRNGTIK